ncbi:MAG: Zn-dependent hydrolase [Pseudomonadota bacterium]
MTGPRNSDLRIDLSRLLNRISTLATIGAIEGGGVSRLALTEDDGLARDHVCALMRDAGLSMSIDSIGNVIGVRAGRIDGPPIMIGSHIDTVRTGGRYDGNLGVLAGLEVINVFDDHEIETDYPVAVAFFTNEEGARFAPDMMGSMVHQGHLPLDAMLAVEDTQGVRVADALQAIGYRGDPSADGARVRAFVELHIEQGPVLERESFTIGAVEGVQGISWTEVTIDGVSNHAGTTPMALRHDAGYAASAIAVFVRGLAERFGGSQVATVGAIDLEPNLVNVIARHARLTVDLRNTDDERLNAAETELTDFIDELREREGVTITTRSLARFPPVEFAPAMIAAVERIATAQGHRVRRLPSGAGHDAQSFAPNCPTGMIFVPSVDGISHNIEEFTHDADIEAGANVLLALVHQLASAD